MSRSHETTITIDAPIEEVWRAISEAGEIQRWFAPEVRVEPGAGGSMFGSWGPGMEGTQRIEVWEPNRRLRLIDERGSARLVVDYHLACEGGQTVLRLVHSGFGPGPDWDGEYEGTRTGWPGFFRTLRHGLERHPGKAARNVAIFHMAPPGDAEQLWRQLLATAPWQGRELLRQDKPRMYQGTVASLDDAMLVVNLSPQPAGNFIYVNLVLYGLSEDEARTAEGQWRDALSQLPKPSPEGA